MQGGVSNTKLAPDLLSLGQIDHQVLWLFYPAGDSLSDLTQLKGKRVALGPPDSGGRAVCEKILAAAGINYDNTALFYLAPPDAVKALDDGTIDALFRNFSPEPPVLRTLLWGPQYRLKSFTEAEALTRIFPYLVRLVLPRGAIDLSRKIPATDVNLVATTNMVLVRKEFILQLSISCRRRYLRHMAIRGFFRGSVISPRRTIRNIPLLKALATFIKTVTPS